MTSEEALRILHCPSAYLTDEDSELAHTIPMFSKAYGQAIAVAFKSLEAWESRWIPVSKRLPENGSLVLTTIQVPGREPHARSGMYFNGLFSNDNGDVWKATDEEVKAWMPLPEPYKAESEVEE